MLKIVSDCAVKKMVQKIKNRIAKPLLFFENIGLINKVYKINVIINQ